MKIGVQIEREMIWHGERGALDLAAASGFDTIDFSLVPLTKEEEKYLQTASHQQVFDRYAALREYANSVGLTVSQTHMPFHLVYHADQTEYNENFCRMQENCIVACEALGTPYAIFHMLQPPLERYCEKYQREGEKLNIEFFGRLMPLLEKHKVQVCIENIAGVSVLPEVGLEFTLCTEASTMLRVIDSFNDIFGKDRFVACVDTGHAFMMGVDPADLIRQLGHRVRSLHVADNNGKADQHLAPYQGKINWPDVMAALKEIHYQGSFSFESDGFSLAFGKGGNPDALRFLYKLGHRMANTAGL